MILFRQERNALGITKKDNLYAKVVHYNNVGKVKVYLSRQRITKECEEVVIDSILLDAPSITPIINSSRTIQQWIDVNTSKSAYIIYKYKSDLCKSQIEQQNKKKKDISQSKSSITIEPIDSMSNLRQINEQQKLQIDELLLSIKQINERIEKQDAKIEKRDVKIAQQDSQIKVLKSNIHSLFIAIKSLTTLNKRILIEKFRLYLVNKYSDLFQNQTGVLVTNETKYRDIYQFMSNFLNDLYQGQGASLITSEEERECMQHVLGNKGSYYQIISDTFVHEATKESIAESVLCTDTTNKHIWINMYKFVFGEEPNLTDICT
ncbi:unnamed protein product [Rotaria sordida]|uniref:Uncharacterized protein n=1 Tax=Rotaria sordida TaxID=392033 RepID=A0A815DUU0_9BILA|nr:unnamed protein product [Rotaria sordida]CAF1306119.1 unnamed protein product [Rotaria sordida]